MDEKVFLEATQNLCTIHLCFKQWRN